MKQKFPVPQGATVLLEILEEQKKKDVFTKEDKPSLIKARIVQVGTDPYGANDQCEVGVEVLIQSDHENAGSVSIEIDQKTYHKFPKSRIQFFNI